MRATELTQPDLKKLGTAINLWINDSVTIDHINYILAHPLAKQFKTSGSRAIYRAMTYRGKENTKILKKRARYPIVAYSQSHELAVMAVEDYELPDPIVCYKKTVKPNEIILNFSAFVSFVKDKLPVFSPTYRDEKEIWMAPSPYYTAFNPKEIVSDTGKETY